MSGPNVAKAPGSGSTSSGWASFLGAARSALTGPHPPSAAGAKSAVANAQASQAAAAKKAGGGGGGGLFEGVTSGVGSFLKKVGSGVKETYYQAVGQEVPPEGSGMRVRGDKSYRERTMRVLSNLQGTKTMQPVFDGLRDRVKKNPDNGVIFEDIPREPKGKPRDDPYTDPRFLGYDKAGKPINGIPDAYSEAAGGTGKGIGSTIYFDPNAYQGPRYKGPPPITAETMAGHELIHAHHNGGGCNCALCRNSPDGRGVKVGDEEAKTIGLPPHDKEPVSENALRAELGMPPRKSHVWPESAQGYNEAARKLKADDDPFEMGEGASGLNAKEKQERDRLGAKVRNGTVTDADLKRLEELEGRRG